MQAKRVVTQMSKLWVTSEGNIECNLSYKDPKYNNMSEHGEETKGKPRNKQTKKAIT